MGLIASEIISIIGIIVNALVTIGLFLIVRLIITRIKGPRLSIFDYKIDEIKSEYTEDRPIVEDVLPKPKWFIFIKYKVLNIGDTSSKFDFNATLTLLDVKDSNTKKSLQRDSRTPVSHVFQPGEWDKLYFNPAFSFIFDDVNAYKWKRAKIEIKGYFFDHKSKKKPIKIDPQIITNPSYPQTLSKEVQDKIDQYNAQQQQNI